MFHPAGFSDSSCDDDGWFDADEKPRSQYFPEDESSVQTVPTIDWDSLNKAAANNNVSDATYEDPAKQKLFERTKKGVKSILLSTKGARVDIFDLGREYHDMFEESIQFSRLGFPTLDKFLESIPSVCRVVQYGHSMVVEGVADANTRHIKMMISAQKNSGKGRKRRGGRCSVPPPPPRYVPPRPQPKPSIPSRPQPSKIPPKVNSFIAKTSASKPPSTSRPPVSSTVPKPPQKWTSNQILEMRKSASASSAKSTNGNLVNGTNSNSEVEPCDVNRNEFLDKFKKHIRAILLSSKRAVPLSQLNKEYLSLWGENIPFVKLNFRSCEELLMSMPDVCKVTKIGSQIFVSGIATQETLDLHRLVSRNGARSGRGRGACLSSIQRCASLGVDDSRQGLDQDQSNNDSEVPSTDINTVITRMKEILLERKFGLPQAQLVKKYESMWNEKLPNVWDKDEARSQFDFEKNGALIVVKNKVSTESQTKPDVIVNGQIDKAKVVQEKMQGLDIQSVVRDVEKSFDEEYKKVIDVVRSILQPRQFGLFKAQVEVMFKKNTGENFISSDWSRLKSDQIVAIEPPHNIVKWIAVKV